VIIRDLAVRLGLETEAASFAEGFSVVELLKAGLEKVSELAHEAKDWLEEQISATAEAGEQALLMAQRLGLSADQVQKLAYVGATAGVSLEAMQGVMRHLAQRGVRDLNGELLRIADQFQHTADGGHKLALAQELLGRTGTDLIPVLNKGGTAIRALMEEAQDLGAVMSKEDLDAAEDYKSSLGRLHAALTGLRNTVVIPLLVPLTKLADAFVRGVVATVKWSKGLDVFNVNLKHIAIALGTVASGLLAYVLWANIGAITTAILSFNFAGAAVAAWAFLAPILLLTAQFVAWGVAIAGVFLLVDDIVVFFQNGDSLIGRALKKWVGPFDTWQEGLQKVWAKVKAGFAEFWEGLGKDPGFAAFVWTINKLVDGLKLIGKGFHGDATPEGDQAKVDRLGFVGRLIQRGNEVTSTGFFHGGAAGPEDAAAVSSDPTQASFEPPNASYAPVTHVHVKVELDGEKLDKRTHAVVSGHHDRVNREAAAAAGS
jgi:hypothetical protein